MYVKYTHTILFILKVGCSISVYKTEADQKVRVKITLNKDTKTNKTNWKEILLKKTHVRSHHMYIYIRVATYIELFLIFSMFLCVANLRFCNFKFLRPCLLRTIFVLYHRYLQILGV